MHKVEIRLTNEGNDAANVFELYTEALGDKGYAESGPMQEVAGGGTPVVMFLEPDERVIVVAKGNKGQIVFDKTQNANVRVETQEEREYRAELDRRAAKNQADQAVRAAQAEVESAKSASEQAQLRAEQNLRRAETARDKLVAEQTKEPEKTPEPAKPLVTLPPSTPPTPTGVAEGTSAPKPVGAPASANTGPIDSKQVKAEQAKL